MTLIERASKHPQIPPQLRGPTPLGPLSHPYYCGIIHVDFQRGHLAESTRDEIVRAIEGLYETAAGIIPPIDLDRALLDGRLPEIETVLASHLVWLKATRAPTQYSDRTWRRVLDFTLSLLKLSGSSDEPEQLRARMLRLETTYAQLRIARPSSFRPVRALPAIVVDDLHEVLSPASNRNPFRTERARMRNYLVFLMLLHLGLRGGELLSLTVQNVRSEFDPFLKSHRHWLDVRDFGDPTETRTRRPRLKNYLAMRQIPLPEALARLIESYVVEFRTDQPHAFLLDSAERRALSAASLAAILHRAAAQLSDEAMRSLSSRSKQTVTPHDLRHTSAVVRLKRLQDAGLTLEEATERLRPFFGWSPSSRMPQYYARAYFEPRFQDTWDELFADALIALRGATGDRHD